MCFLFQTMSEWTLLFNCFSIGSSVHLWSQLKEAEQLLRDQRDLGTDESERSHWPYLSVFHGKPLVLQPSWLSRSFSFGWKHIFRQLDCANWTRTNIGHCFLIYLFLTGLTGLDSSPVLVKVLIFNIFQLLNNTCHCLHLYCWNRGWQCSETTIIIIVSIEIHFLWVLTTSILTQVCFIIVLVVIVINGSHSVFVCLSDHHTLLHFNFLIWTLVVLWHSHFCINRILGSSHYICICVYEWLFGLLLCCSEIPHIICFYDIPWQQGLICHHGDHEIFP